MVELLAASGALSIIGALFSLLLVRWDSAAKFVGCAFGVLAALASLASGLLAIVSEPFLLTAPTVFWFADFTLLWNPLAGLIVVVISLLSVAAWIYGFSYFDEYRGQGIGQIGFYMHLFIISMLLVVLSDNAFWFLVLFELMSLTSYFLVVFDQTKQSIRGGFMYFVMAHVGFMMIMVAFFVMVWEMRAASSSRRSGRLSFPLAWRPSCSFWPSSGSVLKLVCFRSTHGFPKLTPLHPLTFLRSCRAA
ncbi:hypothetical protein [Ellagibacter isourolithinifaciens]|uniref:hypothetical protein n=1 Tax=Ellagibacter isourolithinifaciens TaxID=2137581 RepID=UPI003A908281